MRRRLLHFYTIWCELKSLRVCCTDEQIQPEVSQFIDMLHEVYADFGFTEVIYRLSTRPPQRVGTDEDWDRAEAALAEALNAQGLPWEELPGEGAFYGPKIEFSLKDCIGRVWQLGIVLRKATHTHNPVQ